MNEQPKLQDTKWPKKNGNGNGGHGKENAKGIGNS